MKHSELKSMSKDELENKLLELNTKFGKLQFERKSKTLKKTHELGMIKKDIARVQTLLHT